MVTLSNQCVIGARILAHDIKFTPPAPLFCASCVFVFIRSRMNELKIMQSQFSSQPKEHSVYKDPWEPFSTQLESPPSCSPLRKLFRQSHKSFEIQESDFYNSFLTPSTKKNSSPRHAPFPDSFSCRCG